MTAAIARCSGADVININHDRIRRGERRADYAASHSTGKLSSPRNAQPPIRTGSEWSSRKLFSRPKIPGNATFAAIAREAKAPAQ